MKLRTSLAAAGAAVVLGTTGTLALPAVASAHSASTTLKFIAVTNKSISFGKSSSASQETDVNAAGKSIGFDVLHLTFTSPTTANINVAFDMSGGFLYGTANVTKSGVVANGKVTGGTGAFAGATGTLKAKSAGKNREAITITYTG